MALSAQVLCALLVSPLPRSHGGRSVARSPSSSRAPGSSHGTPSSSVLLSAQDPLPWRAAGAVPCASVALPSAQIPSDRAPLLCCREQPRPALLLSPLPRSSCARAVPARRAVLCPARRAPCSPCAAPQVRCPAVLASFSSARPARSLPVSMASCFLRAFLGARLPLLGLRHPCSELPDAEPISQSMAARSCCALCARRASLPVPNPPCSCRRRSFWMRAPS
uniref:Secreted protein n=1 Tax=Zea mays TaxID=4577 RepID=A0A804MX63_MAIZE